MLRICLCVALMVVAADAAAREVRMSSPGSGGACAEKPASPKDPGRSSLAPRAAPAAAANPKAPTGASGNRLQSPRWHSFLPGMIR